jgi:endonuclease/exonuclease/phosphatase family metal-dependent hydrolase
VIRWCTWNLWAIGPELGARRHAARDALARLAPDLCCLQEVRADASADVATDLATALGLHLGRGDAVGSAWWSERVGEEIRVDPVVLSRWPIEDVSVLELPCRAGATERRSATIARVTTPDGPVRVVSVQLSSSPLDSAVRSAQLQLLATTLQDGRRPDETLLVGGDLNAEPDSDEVRRFCGHKSAPFVDGFVVLDLWRYSDGDDHGWTWDRANPHVRATREPSSRIDHLLAGPTPAGLVPDVSSIERFATGPVDGVWASDHAGVVAELRL